MRFCSVENCQIYLYVGLQFFITQEVIPLFPQLIGDFKHPTKGTTDNNIYHSINYAGFSVIAIKGIQEQQLQIESQQQTIDTQNKKLEDF